VNTYTLLATNVSTGITITVTDASGRCPPDYTTANAVNAQGNGWIDGTNYQKVIRN
jgi:hypothetical protein